MKTITLKLGIILICLFAAISTSNANECTSLNEQSCIESNECILKQKTDKTYFCVNAATKCEIGFIQWGENSKSSCSNKSKCRYISANCYCSPKVVCRCGGGAPAMCVHDSSSSYNKSLNRIGAKDAPPS